MGSYSSQHKSSNPNLTDNLMGNFLSNVENEYEKKRLGGIKLIWKYSWGVSLSAIFITLNLYQLNLNILLVYVRDNKC